jgi:hypothetical protein
MAELHKAKNGTLTKSSIKTCGVVCSGSNAVTSTCACLTASSRYPRFPSDLADVSSDDQVASMFARMVKEFGTIDIKGGFSIQT